MNGLTREFQVRKIGSPTRPVDFHASHSNEVDYEPTPLIRDTISEIFPETQDKSPDLGNPRKYQ